MAGQRLKQFILIFAIVQVWCCQPSDCRRNRTSHRLHRAKHLRNTTDVPAGGSRSSGGILVPTVHPWIGKGFAGREIDNNPDGKDAGFLIGMGENYALAHQQTYDALNKYERPGIEDCSLTDLWCMFKNTEKGGAETATHPRKWELPAPASFHSGTYEPYADRTTFQHVDDNQPLGGSFRLLKFTHPAAGSKLAPKWRDFEAPKLELDPNQRGENCNAYGYSANPSSGSRAGQQVSYTKFPVNTDGCDGAECKLHIDPKALIEGAGVCGGLGDLGMPVICGKEEKLTYLLHKSSLQKDSGCSKSFDAYHVSSIAKNLERGGFSDLINTK